MAAPPGRVTVHRMPAVTEAQVQLRIEPDAIAGSVTTPGLLPEPFAGWLGLIGIIEHIQAELTRATTAAGTDLGDDGLTWGPERGDADA